jgi:hypothetical protein
MDFDDGKKDFRRAGRELSDSADSTAEGVKDTTREAGDELREIADGEDK